MLAGVHLWWRLLKWQHKYLHARLHKILLSTLVLNSQMFLFVFKFKFPTNFQIYNSRQFKLSYVYIKMGRTTIMGESSREKSP